MYVLILDRQVANLLVQAEAAHSVLRLSLVGHSLAVFSTTLSTDLCHVFKYLVTHGKC